MKIGDRVRCVDDGGYDLSVGKVYVIQNFGHDCMSIEMILIQDDAGRNKHFHKSRFIPEEREMKHKDWDSYTFSIRAKEQLDIEAIRKDLSADSPLMIAEFSDSKLVQVFIHDSIWTKAENSGEHWADEYGFGYQEYRYYERLDRLAGQDFLIRKDIHLKPLIKLVKEIKDAEWGKPRKAEVTVRRLRI